MRLIPRLLKIISPAIAALLLLTAAPGCNNRVVVGQRAEEPQQPAPKPAKKVEQKAPQAAQPAQAKPEGQESTGQKEQAPAAKPEARPAPGGMMGMALPKPEAKPAGEQADTTQKTDIKPAGGMMGMALPTPEAKPAGEQADTTQKTDTAPATGGMMGLPPPAKPAGEQTATAAPMSSPAKPKEEKPAAGPAPYKIDISFGGFGLGQGLLDTPVGVAVDTQESIYVVDQANYRIQKFDRFGIFQFAWGRQGMGDGEFAEQRVNNVQTLRETGEFEFNKPIGILLDTDEFRNLIRITVVDSLNNRIQRFLLTQTPGDRFPDGGLQPPPPHIPLPPPRAVPPGSTDVFVMLQKNDTTPSHDTELQDKYEADRRQVILDPVYIFKANNFLLGPFIWGKLGYSQGLLNGPTYLTKDDSGIFWVSDTENGRVQGFYVTPNNPTTDATFVREWGNAINLPYGAGRLNQPTAIDFDNSGFGGFLVLDKLQDGTYNIQRFDRQGQFLGVFTTSGDKEGQLRQPVALAINPFDNSVFVTDRGRKKVMVYNNKGEFLYEFGGDELADPRGIAVLRNNYVYVTDAVKNMVYRYVPQ